MIWFRAGRRLRPRPQVLILTSLPQTPNPKFRRNHHTNSTLNGPMDTIHHDKRPLPTSDSENDSPLISPMESYVMHQMQNHDPSHNPAHVTRVVRLAHRLLAAERARGSGVPYNDTIITLAALLHDIGDRKYIPPGSTQDPTTIVRDTLIDSGCDRMLAQKVQVIVSNVSCSSEIKNPSAVRRLISEEGCPELAIVQDADRLDAIGAVGIGRCFTYLGAKGPRIGANGPLPWELDEAVEHFEEKLVKLESMMKTDSGREMARERTSRLEEFMRWWKEEMDDVESPAESGK